MGKLLVFQALSASFFLLIIAITRRVVDREIP
jgi:hypothetical protein